MIDLNRLKKLVQQEEQPETDAELFFLSAYQAGSSGLAYAEYLREINFEDMTRREIEFVTLGYAWGQEELYFDEEDALSLMIKNKQFH